MENLKVNIRAWNFKNQFQEYPVTSKMFITDPDVPFNELPYKPGDVVFIETENDYGVVLGCIDAYREELHTDLSGMVSFCEISPATDIKDILSKPFGKVIGEFLLNEEKTNFQKSLFEIVETFKEKLSIDEKMKHLSDGELFAMHLKPLLQSAVMRLENPTDFWKKFCNII